MKVLLLLLFSCALVADAQVLSRFASAAPSVANHKEYDDNGSPFSRRKLFQRNTGVIIGIQRGKATYIELGGEAHWRKMSLSNPHIIGATTNLEYNFGNNVLGYKGSVWMKRGRINLTYGANASYFTNFGEGSRFGIGPSVGFRLLGFHIINGYNFLTKDKTKTDEPPIEVNTLYMSFRYYFPVKNNFSWDRKTMKKKKERKKERAKRKRQREKEKESLWDRLKIGGTDEK